jgi:hypothetical protein
MASSEVGLARYNEPRIHASKRRLPALALLRKLRARIHPQLDGVPMPRGGMDAPERKA